MFHLSLGPPLVGSIVVLELEALEKDQQCDHEILLWPMRQRLLEGGV